MESHNSYRKAYQELERIAELIKRGTDEQGNQLDVDALEPLIAQAKQAHQQCIARIERVEVLLKED